MKLTDKYVLITGASSGLGQAMARIISEQYGANLILAARNYDRLVTIKSSIEDNNSVDVKLLKADLSLIADVRRTTKYCLNQSDFYGAILNAGVTYVGEHVDITQESFFNLINLNITGTALLLTEFTKHFENKNLEGKLMVVSSMAADIPTPYQSLYSGSKAFLSNFTNALSHELTNPNLSLGVFSPGGIKTKMTDIPEFSDLKNHLMDVEVVAKEGVLCFIKSKYNYIPGRLNQLSMILSKCVKRKFVSTTIGKRYKKSIDTHK